MMSDNGDSSSEISENVHEHVGEDEAPKVGISQLIVEGSGELLNNNEFPSLLSPEDGSPSIKPRPYQTEMVEESMRRNIIVAMDTGSGKTHIAVMRMVHELERMQPNQRIWFLAPTVTLCSQQYEYIKSQITSAHTKLLSSEDNVDRWTEQSLWDAVLKNVKIVVSTYQILLDVLSHAFLTIQSLALIVFDEAHNCLGKSAGAKIMQLFYHGRKAKNLQVPHILGLSASPVMKSKATSIINVEKTLSAIVRTPIKHRSELRTQVRLPTLSRIYYQSLPPESLLSDYTRSLASLGNALRCLKITEDPYYLSLLHAVDSRSLRRLEEVRLNQKTWSRTQMKIFHATALKICKELGGWAADRYISQVIDNTLLAANRQNVLSTWDVPCTEREYLANILKEVEVTRRMSLDPAQMSLVSDKVGKLLDLLLREKDGSSGIVFVAERAVAVMLANLISMHPLTKERYRVQTIVGSSSHNNRSRSIGELVDSDSSKIALSHFRSGKTNLVIATSVLEEGIDIPSCNLVICFQKPANLKSFIQRRGRARHQDSKLILLLDSTNDTISDFEQCEKDMRDMYEDEMRTLQESLAEEDAEEAKNRCFTVASTGAILDLDNSVSHLYHFCATLRAQYIDLRPNFICNRDATGCIRAKVILPLSVHESVRIAESKQSWRSEKNAIKDASFEAYCGLYKAGLISENLLPLFKKDDLLGGLHIRASDTRASIMTVNEVLNPWINIAKKWKEPSLNVYSLNVSFEGAKYQILFPNEVPLIPSFFVYWDSNSELLLSFTAGSDAFDLTSLMKAQKDTHLLIQSAFGHRRPVLQKDFIMPVLIEQEHFLGLTGHQSIPTDLQSMDNAGLVRDILEPEKRYIFQKLIPQKPAIEDVQTPYSEYDKTPGNQPHISVKRLTRRADFLHRVSPSQKSLTTKEFSTVLPATRCTMDPLPFQYVQFGLMIPSIMRRIEIYLIAERLSRHILQDVQMKDITLIVTAICASSANEATNYQRQEFLGDSILKLCISIQLTAKYPLYPEGYLTIAKAQVISNHRLCKAAIDIGLDNYIVTKAFTGLKWRPLYIDDALESPSNSTREMSSKVLADVVEALIGAAMIDGGFPKALACLQTFIPEIDWRPLGHQRELLYARFPEVTLPSTLEPVEKLLDYKFNKKGLLIEAVTHASFNSGLGSFERLEFLGDAILDHIIVTAMSSYNLSHVQMHAIRTAVVNADFLAVMCMELSIEQEIIDLKPDYNNQEHGITEFKENPRLVSLPLWKFMRHMSPDMGREQVETEKRYTHNSTRERILYAINEGGSVPWTLLASIGAPKFYSDLIESIIGAVWIDSGSFETCTALVEKMGILAYFRRIIKDGVHVLHPKEELGILADQEKVKYILVTNKISAEGGLELGCKVEVGGEEVVQVVGGLNREEVQLKAAEQAIQILKMKGLGREKQTSRGDVTTAIDVEVEMGGLTNFHDL